MVQTNAQISAHTCGRCLLAPNLVCHNQHYKSNSLQCGAAMIFHLTSPFLSFSPLSHLSVCSKDDVPVHSVGGFVDGGRIDIVQGEDVLRARDECAAYAILRMSASNLTVSGLQVKWELRIHLVLLAVLHPIILRFEVVPIARGEYEWDGCLATGD